MSAYVVVEIDIHDPEKYDRYRKLAPPSIAQYDGRYIVRGGTCQALEGTWSPPRFVMLQFPNVERARAWWSSPEYAEAKALRQSAATTRMLVVEGLPPGWTPG